MNESEQINAARKLSGWERMVIFSGVVLSVPLYILLGTAIYAFAVDRSDAYMGLLLSIIALLVLWAIVWGTLWIVSGFSEGGNGETLQNNSVNNLEVLQRENEHLKKQLAELAKEK